LSQPAVISAAIGGTDHSSPLRCAGRHNPCVAAGTGGTICGSDRSRNMPRLIRQLGGSDWARQGGYESATRQAPGRWARGVGDLLASRQGDSCHGLNDAAGLPLCDGSLEELAPHLQDTAPERRPFIQNEPAVVGQGHLPRHRHRPPPDQPHRRNGVMRRPEGPRRALRRAGAGAGGDAMDPRGVNGFREGHRRQEGGEPPGQPGLARPGTEQDVCPLTRGATTGTRHAAAGQAQGRA
jgi:hypothetical protein